MIPASYLFKDVYRQHWQEPDMLLPTSGSAPLRGLVVPLAGMISVLRALHLPLASHGSARHVHQ